MREERGQVSSGCPRTHRPRGVLFLFLFYYYSSHLLRGTHPYLIPISPPDLHQQKRKRLECQNHSPLLRALWWDASQACLAFSAKPENETARCRSLQIFPSTERSLQALADPSCSCYKSGHALTQLLPIRFRGIQSSPSAHTTAMSSAANEILNWTSKDPRQSQLFSSWGVVYRFQVRFRRAPRRHILYRDRTYR